MTDYAGVLVPVLIGKETTFGTAVSTVLPLGYMTTVRTSEKNNHERVHALGARDAQAIIAKLYEASGSVEGNYTTSRIFACALGTEATTGGVAPYTHTITPENTLKYYTLEASMNGPSASDDVLRKYSGVTFTNLTFDSSLDAVPTFSSDFLAKDVSVTELSTGGTPGFDTNIVPPLAPQFANLKIDGSTAVGRIQKMTWKVENETDYVKALGSRFAQAPMVKKRTYDISGSLIFNSSGATGDAVREIYARFCGDTSSPFTPSSSGTTAVDTLLLSIDNGGSGAAKNSISLNMDGFVVDSVDLNESVGDLVTLDFTSFCAKVDTSALVVGQDGLDGTAYGDAHFT